MIEASDRGFLLGDGVFETMLAGNRVALWREGHLTRMRKAARKLDIAFERERIDAEIDASLAKADPGALVLRVTLTRGTTTRGLAAEGAAATLLVTAEPFDTAAMGKPITLARSSIRRNPASVTDRHKTTSYANNIFAAREAKLRGADDCLMLNQDGLVACTSIANIFICNGAELVTPPEQDGVLPGIMRAFVLEHAAGFGFSAHVRSIEMDELFDADTVFVTNSLRLAAPVASLDGTDLKPAPVSAILDAMLQSAREQSGFDFKRSAP